MIDLPPDHDFQTIEAIQSGLVECGLDRNRFTVEWSDLMQSVEIRFDKEASVTAKDFECIHAAAGYSVVSFDDMDLQIGYSDFQAELIKPQLLARAKQSLREKGLLDGFPAKSSYTNDKEYAEALESHCGLEPGSVLKEFEGGLLFQPAQFHSDFSKFENEFSCLFSAVIYAQSLLYVKTFGFAANAGPPENEDQ